MASYEFLCTAGHRETKILPMDERDSRQICSACRRRSVRQFSPPGITREHLERQMYDFEREKWALATGVNHRTAGELDQWAKANGKTILNNRETVKPVDHLPSDREIEKAIERVHSDNFNVGEIR